MPIIGSSAKRQRQSEKRRMRNRMSVSTVRTSRKKFLAAVEEKDKAKAETLLKSSQKLIDTAASKGVLKKNTAARMKARLQKKYNLLAAS